MYFIQVAALVIVGPGNNWLDWLHIFNFNSASAFGSVCVAPLDAYSKMGFTLLMPFVLFGELIVTAVTHDLVSKAMNFTDRRFRFQHTAYKRSSVALFLFSYTQLASSCFAYLVCRLVSFVRAFVPCGVKQQLRGCWNGERGRIRACHRLYIAALSHLSRIDHFHHRCRPRGDANRLVRVPLPSS